MHRSFSCKTRVQCTERRLLGQSLILVEHISHIAAARRHPVCVSRGMLRRATATERARERRPRRTRSPGSPFAVSHFSVIHTSLHSFIRCLSLCRPPLRCHSFNRSSLCRPPRRCSCIRFSSPAPPPLAHARWGGGQQIGCCLSFRRLSLRNHQKQRIFLYASGRIARHAPTVQRRE